MNVTEKLLSGELQLDVIHQVPSEEIINLWTPGDWNTHRVQNCVCIYTFGYHDCELTFPERWSEVLDMIMFDDRYGDVYDGVKEVGFKAPVGAKLGHDGNHIVLIDGHHRTGVALELSIAEIPVYVASQAVDVFDLVAMDSGFWNRRSKGIDSPFDHMVG